MLRIRNAARQLVLPREAFRLYRYDASEFGHRQAARNLYCEFRYGVKCAVITMVKG